MCLISVLPKGTVKYNDEVIEFVTQGFHSNRDGSGFMYKRNGEEFIHVNKGFFKLDSLLKAIEECNLTADDELAVHHRIGTAGAISAANTHPFVVSREHAEVVMLTGRTNKPVLVHNGMFRGLGNFESLNPEFSDTYAFTRYVLTNTIEDLVENKNKFLKAFDTTLGWSRLCLLFPDRDLFMTGDFTEDNGYFHSNSGYKAYVRNVGGVEWASHGHSSKTGAGVTKSRVLQLPPGDKERLGKSKSPFVLNDTFIEINSFNYKHFCFTRKDKTNNIVYKFDSYDENALVNMIWGVNNKMGQGITREKLHAEYEFHPYKKWEKYYAEYVDLIMDLTPSKTLLKKMFKIMNKQRYKSLDHIFKFNNKNMTKVCAINYYLWFKDVHLTDHTHLLTTGHHPLYSEFNMLDVDIKNLGVFGKETEDELPTENPQKEFTCCVGFAGKSQNDELIPAN